MGHVILPSGTSVWVNELSGSVNLSQLVQDMKCGDYTTSYRISVISAIGSLGKHATSVLLSLKELAANKETIGNERLLVDAAEQALKKVEESDHTDNRHRTNVHGVQSGCTSTYEKKPEVQKVTFTELEETKTLHDGLKVYCRCGFCNKITIANPYSKYFSEKLTGNDKFFCNFCIRNDYYQRFSNNIMLLTYRGIIGYYYYSYYVAPKSQTMYLMDINEAIELHVRAGTQNPAFRYDPETYCWFIDFSKIGKGNKKIAIEYVLHTIVEQLTCFNLYENVKDCSPSKLYKKYESAVMEFYQHRARVNGEKIFAPTLWGCDIPTVCPAGTRAIPVDILTEFVSSDMIEGGYRSNVRRF